MKDSLRLIGAGIIGACLYAFGWAVWDIQHVEAPRQSITVQPTTNRVLEEYLEKELDVGTRTRWTLGPYTLDVLGCTTLPTDLGLRPAGEDTKVYALALPADVYIDSPIVRQASPEFKPIVLLEHDGDDDVRISGQYGWGFPFFVIDTTTNQVFKSDINVRTDTFSVENISEYTFLISSGQAEEYQISTLPIQEVINDSSRA